MLDVAVAYNRYKYLGNEFLTWLWFMMETDRSALEFPEAESTNLEIGNRIVLENNRHNRDETITIKGDGAGLEEGVIALKKGALVTEISLVVKAPESEWRFQLKGESLNITSLKPPEKNPGEAADDMEQRVLEQLAHVERADNLVHQLYQQFIRHRLSEDWANTIVPAMTRWIGQSASS
ncbi:MAG: hypothetical protein KGY61_06665 [Desulfobacterales bacterium]|nr:hypothetical protein [Desulfobacterales bacterium]